jgi:hypothetical protein
MVDFGEFFDYSLVCRHCGATLTESEKNNKLYDHLCAFCEGREALAAGDGYRYGEDDYVWAKQYDSEHVQPPWEEEDDQSDCQNCGFPIEPHGLCSHCHCYKDYNGMIQRERPSEYLEEYEFRFNHADNVDEEE